MGAAGALLTALVLFGPNGHLLLPALAPAEVRAALPADAFLPLASRLWVVYHEHPEWPMALYLPAADDPADLSLHLFAADAERLLPALRVPRLFLYAPYFRRPAPAVDMPLDVAQYLFGALLEALFDLAPPADLDAQAAGRNREGYVSALAAFGSHALATAVELRRSLARQRAAGKDPCAIIDHPATLFGLWRGIFTTEEYRGQIRLDGKPPRWALGPPITESDKAYFVERVFGGFWTGDPRRDFGLGCQDRGGP